MKKYFLFFLLLFTWQLSYSQVICVFCYNQNDSVSQNVTNLIVNGGFENTDCLPAPNYEIFCPASLSYSCDIANWTCTGGGASSYCCVLSSSSTIVPEGNLTAYLGNYFCNPCSAQVDDTSCVSFIDCMVEGIPAGYPTNTTAFGGNTGVSLAQTVSGLTIGSVYVLEFWAGGEAGPFVNRGVFGVDVGFGQMMLQCKPTNPNSTDIGIHYIIEFRATTAAHTIKFTNWGHICSSCTEVILDNVRLYPVAQVSPTVPPCDSAVPPPTAGVDSLFIPNVFTPNNQDPNNFFEIKYSGTKTYFLTIYNRWGQEVFTSADKNSHWDGRIENKEASEGTYFYVLVIGEEKYSGFLTLLR